MLLNRNSCLIAALTALYFCSFFQRFAIPGPVFGDLQQHYGLSGAQLSLLGAMYVAIYAILQLPAGGWIDRKGGIVPAAVGGVALLTGSGIFLLAHHPAWLFAGRAVTAVGDSVMYLALLKEVSRRCAPESFASILGIVSLLASLAGVIATLPLQSAVRHWGYFTAFGAMWGFTLAAVAVFIFAFRRDSIASAPVATRRLRLLEVGKRLRNWPVFLAMALDYGIVFALQVIIGIKFLADRQGLGAETASRYLFIMLTVSLVFLVGAPAVGRRWCGNRHKRFVIAGAMLSIGGCLALLYGTVNPLPGWLLVAALSAVAIQGGHIPMATAQLKGLNPPEDMATVGGLLAATIYLVIAVEAGIIAWVLDFFPRTETGYPAAAYTAIFTLFLSAACVALACAWISKEKCPQPLERG